ncbi:GNAT family N-acetyltransferase [Streptomyces sp. NPDC002476]|uniref:GNAT family N-acetyltransferase n=1 Tax=Streptomyces sp. NPDC002476 TaxID=3364648 RepID=UPI00367CF49A
MTWTLTHDVEVFLDAAGASLTTRPAENTLVLTVTAALRLGGPHAFGDADPLLGWWRGADGSQGRWCRPRPERLADERTASGGLTLWEDGGVPVSMAGVSPRIAGMVRIAAVCTPPEHGRRGYASAVTARASRAARKAGAAEVLLFTDLANPTSNGVYRRIGYRPVSDRLLLAAADR